MPRLCAILLSLALISLASAGQPQSPPGQNKLPAPTGVICTVVDGGGEVTFEGVDGAGGYQVQYACINVEDVLVEQSVFIAAPPTSEVPEACSTVLAARVRATPTVGPQGGPKGEWSDVVTCGGPVQLPTEG